MCIYIHIPAHTQHIHTCVYMYIYICLYIHIYVHFIYNVCVYICIHMCICMYINVYIYTYLYINMCIYYSLRNSLVVLLEALFARSSVCYIRISLQISYIHCQYLRMRWAYQRGTFLLAADSRRTV